MNIKRLYNEFAATLAAGLAGGCVLCWVIAKLAGWQVGP